MAMSVVIAPNSTRRQKPVPAPGRKHGEDIVARLRKATGQLSGVRSMYEDDRYCVDVLGQLSAVTAAVDSAALLILEDHTHACLREAVHSGKPDEKIAELVFAVRRFVRAR
jgi:DNA-binding FrmR family transcriptional regulator